MIIMKMKGGLGNQMFEYALARRLSLEYNQHLVLDTFSYIRDRKRNFELDNYNVKYDSKNGLKTFFYNILYKIYKENLNNKFKVSLEKKLFVFQDEIFQYKYSYLNGYWQNPKYFESIRDILLEDFRYKGELTEVEEQIIQTIQSQNSVAVHFRRDDYLNQENTSFFEVQSLDYYSQAINHMKKKIPQACFYVFSDDIDWCKNNLKEIDNVVFIDGTTSSSHHIDFLIMKSCKHFIIANSTFSWWAAWLSESENKQVIIPNKWFKDKEINDNSKVLVLEGWIVM